MPTPTGYSRLQIALHWIAALLILWQYLFNEAIARAWQAAAEGREVAFGLMVPAHVLAGAAILLITLWRLAIKARRGIPAMIGDNALLNLVARLTHLGLYALMILMPISGAAAWFGGIRAAAGAHNLFKILLLALIVLHIVGALYHRIVLNDGVMERMSRPAE